MNKIVNKFLLAGEKFKPKLHLRQLGLPYSTCRRFVKHRESIQKFRKTNNLKHLYRKELDKSCFGRDAVYSDSKDLAKGTILDKVLKDRAYEIATNPNCDGYQRGLASMVYKFFDKKTWSGVSVNRFVAEELLEPVIKKFKRRKVYPRFTDNIWAADLAKMSSIIFFQL